MKLSVPPLCRFTQTACTRLEALITFHMKVSNVSALGGALHVMYFVVFFLITRGCICKGQIFPCLVLVEATAEFQALALFFFPPASLLCAL